MSSLWSKKRKVEDENRLFQEKWDRTYFITNVPDKIRCHLSACVKSITCADIITCCIMNSIVGVGAQSTLGGGFLPKNYV